MTRHSYLMVRRAQLPQLAGSRRAISASGQRTYTGFTLVVACGLILTGCMERQEIEQSPPSTESDSTPQIVPPTATAVRPQTPLVFQDVNARARAIVWARSVDPATGAPIDRTDVFPADAPRLYAVAPFEYIADGVTLRGEWTYNNTTMPALASVSKIEAPQADVWIVFQLGRSGERDWPDGDYQLTVLVDDQPALTSTVRVESVAPTE